MSFKKRSTVISATSLDQALVGKKPENIVQNGARPSPLDGRLTISTGTSSLDQLLAGHAGLPLGTSLLIEEHGTTDFAGALLRYYAAEGLVQGHQVHVLGFSDAWLYELPALAEPNANSSRGALKPGRAESADKMKIAWRYEALSSRQTQIVTAASQDSSPTHGAIFCHNFDMTKRLARGSIKGTLHALPGPNIFSLDDAPSPTLSRHFIEKIKATMRDSPPALSHRVVIPSLLSPTIYPTGSPEPIEVLTLLHQLRALLRSHSDRLTAMISLPVSLFPRSSGLTRWMELLCDGVIELIPLDGNAGMSHEEPSRAQDGKQEAKSQGMLRVHSLPIYHEKGGGRGSAAAYFREDLSFSLSASKGLIIKPYSLPPLSDDGGKEKSPASTVKDGIDF
jgi:elongator complex protein 4